MSSSATANFVAALRESRLLSSAQWEEFARDLAPRFPELRALARQLLDRDWVTPFQVNQLILGRGPELVLGPYVLLERLGTGVLGQVYKAQHRRMNRLVALKVIREDLLAQPEAVERFYRDVEAVSQLSHPNLVHAYDAGPIGRTHFFAAEFVQGIDLGRLVGQVGALPSGPACAYLRQAARGLQHAFERGVLHHDLKPSNLTLVRRTGLSYQADSDSSRRLVNDAAGGSLIKVRNLGFTLYLPSRRETDTPLPEALLPEGFLEAPDYCAPERAAGGYQPDVRSSLYSLGCILYFLLTAHVPFPGGGWTDKLRRHQFEEPMPIELLSTDVPGDVIAVIRRLMAKHPDVRYATPGDVAAALTPFARAERSGAEVAP
jgi:serine/threonine protein kinase